MAKCNISIFGLFSKTVAMVSRNQELIPDVLNRLTTFISYHSNLKCIGSHALFKLLIFLENCYEARAICSCHLLVY